jgi:hypothetical protein
VLIALDETGAALMSKKYGGDGTRPPFSQPEVRAVLDLDTLFLDADKLDADLKTVKQGLTELGVAFRIFRSSIVIQESS